MKVILWLLCYWVLCIFQVGMSNICEGVTTLNHFGLLTTTIYLFVYVFHDFKKDYIHYAMIGCSCLNLIVSCLYELPATILVAIVACLHVFDYEHKVKSSALSVVILMALGISYYCGYIWIGCMAVMYVASYASERDIHKLTSSIFINLMFIMLYVCIGDMLVNSSIPPAYRHGLLEDFFVIAMLESLPAFTLLKRMIFRNHEVIQNEMNRETAKG